MQDKRPEDQSILTIKRRSKHIQRAMLALPKWITPNGVTVFRALLVVPVITLLRTGHYWAALVTFAVAMILDFVDGALAAARNDETTFGAFLDPLGDKILICGTLVGLIGLIPNRALNIALILEVTLVGIFSVLLTGLRILKIRGKKDGDVEPDVKANDFGKRKLIAETIGVLLIICGLGITEWDLTFIDFYGEVVQDSLLFMSGGVLVLSWAIVLAYKSFFGQLETKQTP